ncbi:hypothetical protein PNEG_01818 [Pneumocystis murina B123]|uniref:JAB1/MPN/MOV34 metalloenzyme domain-containing protein n=1 Tax=Pneumocystis murina (strain B123) TaxID=1069680 RepID=M7NS11_PNEMU|nr:hypothetical protein PNEG_01818 [Pneumocystis murina B123]EMR10067.1 hypothetical protein PNEG_01818 [Pneumocystis murina B123]
MNSNLTINDLNQGALEKRKQLNTIVSLHPLVLFIISDYYMRHKSQTNKSLLIPIAGALFGNEDNNKIIIENAMEIKLIKNADMFKVDETYFELRLEQLKAVFSNYSFLGWFFFGSFPGKIEVKIHEQLLKYNQNALLLLVDIILLTSSKINAKLPIKIYKFCPEESSLSSENYTDKNMFIEEDYQLNIGEPETVIIDYMSKVAENSENKIDDKKSEIIADLLIQINVINVLQQRIEILKKYLIDVKTGIVSGDPNLLRQIASLCSHFPITQNGDFQELQTEYNSALLINHLSLITKSFSIMKDLFYKHKIIRNNTNKFKE